MSALKTYTYKVTNYDGQLFTGFILAERKLTASFLISQRYKDKGLTDFRVSDINLE